MSVFDLNVSDIFSAIGGGSPLSIINSVLHPEYAIRRHGDSAVALSFSGMVSVAPEGQATIVTAQLSRGNTARSTRCEGAKVRQPSRVRCAVVISGLTGFTGTIQHAKLRNGTVQHAKRHQDHAGVCKHLRHRDPQGGAGEL